MKNNKRTNGTVTASPIDALVKVARTVTPDTFDAAIKKATSGHTVTHAGRNIGRTTNRRIVDFQNWAFEQNRTWQLDDVQLAFLYRAEFPMAAGAVFCDPSIARRIHIIRSIRAEYNRNGHGNPTGKPSNPVDVYGAKRFDFGPVVDAAPVKTDAKKAAPAKSKK